MSSINQPGIPAHPASGERAGIDLDAVRVGDAMHAGILSCDSHASLDEVARLMARHRVHAIAIADEADTHPVAIVSDLDVVGAMVAGRAPRAGQVAATEPLTVTSAERLSRAAQLMAEHGVSHLVVVDAAGGHPVGVLSTTDLAAVYAGSENR